MDSFGTKFKKIRLLKNLTQEQLVNDFNKKFHYNLTKSAISQYENDKRFPEITSLVDFARYFNVSLDFLLSRNEKTDEAFEEAITNYVIDTSDEPFRIEEFLDNFEKQIRSASRVVLLGKTATKKQITIINTAIKIGLQLAKKEKPEN